MAWRIFVQTDWINDGGWKSRAVYEYGATPDCSFTTNGDPPDIAIVECTIPNDVKASIEADTENYTILNSEGGYPDPVEW